ncbi:MAG: RluA family pseudouridine synthase [Elusimicrobia bacterium]|nr:RluA family pseudouridine synthase [Elusimicrobiota bacterium]
MTKLPLKISCSDSAEGVRFDQFLAEKLGFSRSQAKHLIEDGSALVDGRRLAPDARLKGGETVSVSQSRPELPHGAGSGRPGSPWPKGERCPWPDLEARVLAEDRSLLVLDKPAGLLMHPLGTSWLSQPEAALMEPVRNLAALLQGIRPGIVRCGTPRCGIVHRLDRATSGVLLVAKNPQAYERLTEAFRDRTVSKVYKAIVVGVPAQSATAPTAADAISKGGRGGRPPASITVDAPVGRSPGRRLVKVTPLGRESVTSVKVVARGPGAALVEARPLTGRTHQIRAHLAHLGHPVLGDPEVPVPAGYPKPPRMMLHAWRIELTHPLSGRKVRYQAPVPRDFADYWSRLKAP